MDTIVAWTLVSDSKKYYKHVYEWIKVRGMINKSKILLLFLK